MNQSLRSVCFLVLFLPIAGCGGLEAVRHNYVMRGQILEMKGDTAYLCMGSRDGAQVGQEFTVFKYERQPSVHQGIESFKRKATGTVRTVQILDEHMATATIVSGEAKVNYVVELDP